MGFLEQIDRPPQRLLKAERQGIPSYRWLSSKRRPAGKKPLRAHPKLRGEPR